MDRNRTPTKRQQKGTKDRLTHTVAVKQELQRLVNAVRNKFKLLRRNADEVRDTMERGAQPFIAPLQKAVSEGLKTFVPIKQEVKVEKDDSQDIKSKETSTQTERPSWSEKYLKRFADPVYKDKLDFTYGVRPDGSGGTLIGDSAVTFSKGKINIKGESFEATRGLLELLFMKVPGRLLFSKNDLTNYKDILMLTNGHRQSYSFERPINSNRGKKYTTVISPMFFPAGETVSVGSGVQFVQYDQSFNTLVNRLRLLVMSRYAGHTAHDTEISEIMKLLHDNGVIEL